MKTLLYKLFLLAVFLLFFVSCGDDTPINTQPQDEPSLYEREDAANTTIPLQLNNSWLYKRNVGGTERPDQLLEIILPEIVKPDSMASDAIIDMKILPIRRYDDGKGTGKYEYQALCYISQNGVAYFYMGEKIYVGRYMEKDSYGLESVSWDFELPVSFTETSSRYFIMNRNKVNVEQNEYNYLHELGGYYTIDVKKPGSDDFKRYTECKKFQYLDTTTNGAAGARTNVFYFKQGRGLIRYQQFITDTVLLYEQELIAE